MDLPITEEEFNEVLDAVNKDHWDFNKREYRKNLYNKLKLVKELRDQGLPYKKILREQYGVVA